MVTTTCDLNTPVPDWIVEHPVVEPLLTELHLDSTCGGKSLGYICIERGYDPAVVLQKLHECLDAEANSQA